MADYGQWNIDPSKLRPYSAPTKQSKSKVTGRGNKYGSAFISEGGAAAGAAAGGAIGSIIPGLGTGIGALVGGAIGGFTGRLAENKVRDDRWGGWQALGEGGLNAIPFGTVAGKGAKGFKAAKAAGKVFKGVDKLPRFEIDDSNSVLKTERLKPATNVDDLRFQHAVLNLARANGKATPEALARLQTLPDEIKAAKSLERKNNTFGLSEFLDHPDLYTEYPDLAKMKVKLYNKRDLTDKAYYNDQADTLHINKLALDSDPRKVKDTVLHEIQHAIQKREDFAQGGSPDAIKKRLLEEARGYTGEDRRLARDFADDEAYTEYRHLAGEAEARAVAARADMPMSERYKLPDPNSFDDYYHGSTKPIDEYDFSKSRSGVFGKAAYITNDKQVAGYYGDVNNFRVPKDAKLYKSEDMATKVKDFELAKSLYKRATGKELNIPDSRTFWSISDHNGSNEYTEQGKKAKELWQEHLKKQGYDGVQEEDTVAIFNPEKILSQKQASQPRSTFYDSLDVPKDELIVRPAGVQGGTSMFIARHGSDANFDKFDPNKIKDGVFGKAAYLSENEDVPSMYGDITHEFDVPDNVKLHESTRETKLSDFKKAAELYKHYYGMTLDLPSDDEAAQYFWKTTTDPEINNAKQLWQEHMQKKGYQGIREDDTVAIFDPSILKKMSSKYSNTYSNVGLNRVGQSVEPPAPKVFRSGPETYKENGTELVARERFNIPALKKLSSGGSDRDVYDLGDGHVLKVSKTARGLAQNQSEVDYYAQDAGLIPETVEAGKNYVVSVKVNPPDAKTRKMVNEMRDKFGYSDWEKKTPELQEFLEKHDLSEILNYDILQGDYTGIRNWGTTLDGKPIHLDGGTLAGQTMRESIKQHGMNAFERKHNLADPEFKAIYDKSKAAKKKFGDMDKATMYGIAGLLGGGAVLSGASKDNQNEYGGWSSS